MIDLSEILATYLQNEVFLRLMVVLHLWVEPSE